MAGGTQLAGAMRTGSHQPGAITLATEKTENSGNPGGEMLPHARERVPEWIAGWEDTGRLVLLLDFDGTLAPIVARPELAAILPGARSAMLNLLDAGADVAIVSGRGLADARGRVGVHRVAYAGNHGMEIDGPGVERIHPDAAVARPVLERIAAALRPELADVEGAIIEDKGLTLSVHYRLVESGQTERVRQSVTRVVGREPAVRLTEGKKVLEVRPRVEWDKGRAVLFLLDHLQPAAGVPVLYIGDDTTDEDAFRALAGRRGGGEGVVVGNPPPASTAARSYLRSPEEVAELLATLAEQPPA